MRSDLGGTLEDEEWVPGRGCVLEPVVHTGGRTEERHYLRDNQSRAMHTVNCEVLNGDTADGCVDGCSPRAAVHLQIVGFQDCCGKEWRKMGAGANSKGSCRAGRLWELQAGGECSDWNC